MTQFSRRRFLRMAGSAAAVALPSAVGCWLLSEARGTVPLPASPYETESWEERTASSTASGPILLLLDEQSQNPLGTYLAEILLAEGLNCFQVAPVSAIGQLPTARFDLILLAETSLSSVQAGLMESYVANGGQLVAMRPDARLASVLGLKRLGDSTAEGHLRAAANHPIAEGISSGPLLFHGTADHYHLAGAQAVAWLVSETGTSLGLPAVTIHSYERGQAAMWAFDLARSVAYSRQGNPALSSQEGDDVTGLRASDMFAGWVDLDRISVPYADEQQRLLVNLIAVLCQDRRPLPRLWYFPGNARGMLIATGDSHQNPATAVESLITQVEQHGGHVSIYYAPHLSSHWRRTARRAKRWIENLPLLKSIPINPSAPPTPRLVGIWRDRGHEFGFHPYVEAGLDTGIEQYWRETTGLGYGPVPPTVRTHRVLWTGWVETARVQAAFGLRMNLDYYHWGPTFRDAAGRWVYGHFTGSGLPMKFIDQEGRILSIYQQPTQLVDEHLLDMPWISEAIPRLTAEDAVQVSQMLLRHSLEGAYSALATQFHVDAFAIGGDTAAEMTRWIDGTLGYAASRGIPIWSAIEWLRFTESRHDARVEEVSWHPESRRLTFRFSVRQTPDIELTLMIPSRHVGTQLVEVKVDDRPQKHHEHQVGCLSYGCVSITSSSHQVTATYA